MSRQNRQHEEMQASADLRFFFSSDSLFWRSPMGLMLEKARVEHFDSNSRPIPRPRQWNWLPPVGKHKPDPHMVVSKVRNPEGGGYEPDSEDILRHGSISRRILALTRKHPRHYDVLAAFHADRGARWAAASQDRFDREGKLLAKGIGPGALASIYPLTPSGRALIQRERSASTALRPRLALIAEKTAAQKAAHDTAREAIEAEIEDVGRRLEGMVGRRKAAEQTRSVVLSEISVLRAAKTQPSTTLRDRASRSEEEVSIIRTEEAELQRMLLLLRTMIANSAIPSSLPSPEAPPPAERKAWLDEFTAAMSPFDKQLAIYHAEKLRREQALVERSSVLRRLSKEGPIFADDPRLPSIPPEPVKPMKPMGMAVPNAPQARLPTLYDQNTSPSAEMSDDDVLLVVFLLQRKNNTMSRRKILLDKARDEATRMFVQATDAWLEIARKHAPPSTLPPSGTRDRSVDARSFNQPNTKNVTRTSGSNQHDNANREHGHVDACPASETRAKMGVGVEGVGGGVGKKGVAA